ncbi:MAG: aminotransferase class I/II-fold pyridoxal phosphate-dependent enzyme [Actinomycetota bacterium]|nr:aminotransferase class I/II-fold pyridoxal phosphate-dependent enzyme [Actinomycetota bacterium]
MLEPSTTYAFSDTDEFALATEAKTGSGYVYTRWANPTIDAFEAAVAGLEGAPDAEAFSSGMAAISAVFLSLCSSGDRIVAARQLYGGSYSVLSHTLPRYGITTTFADVSDLDTLAAACRGAKLLYCETIGNPVVEVADLPRLAAIAEDAGIPLVVDNTFASPILCRPIEHGATMVVHSATKFLGGHHDLTGGVLCSSREALEPVKELARELGPTLAPFSAWLALRGLATLHLRVERSSDSALAVGQALIGRDDVESVNYPALEDDAAHELTAKLLGGRGGGTLGFSVAGGRERAARFQSALRLIRPAASLGGTHSLIVHAATVTHTQLSKEELEAVGISEGFCRLSVGLEDVDDILDDLEQALERSR